jgi:hypothetical protein
LVETADQNDRVDLTGKRDGVGHGLLLFVGWLSTPSDGRVSEWSRHEVLDVWRWASIMQDTEIVFLSCSVGGNS